MWPWLVAIAVVGVAPLIALGALVATGHGGLGTVASAEAMGRQVSIDGAWVDHDAGRLRRYRPSGEIVTVHVAVHNHSHLRSTVWNPGEQTLVADGHRYRGVPLRYSSGPTRVFADHDAAMTVSFEVPTGAVPETVELQSNTGASPTVVPLDR